MYLNLETHPAEKIVLIDDLQVGISFGELIQKSNQFYKHIGKRTLIFLLVDNSIESFVAYYASMNNQVVPLLLNHKIDSDLLNKLISAYHPEYLFIPKSRIDEFNFQSLMNFQEFVLVKSNFQAPSLNAELAMLLPTSGSTGSPKLVRHKVDNLEFSASSVGEVFSVTTNDCAIALLPMYYTMGLSVINSYLKAGSKVVLTNKSLTDRDFWKIVKEQQVTCFTGVPYSFEILDKLRFSRMDLPDLKIITQGGGKLKEELFEKFAQVAQEKNMKFIPTYGQTEGSARMAYLTSEKVFEKKGSIGKAIPGGYLGVINDAGEELLEEGQEVIGEMIYKGPNVTLGYAENLEDLIKGDENKGILMTGDIVRRDSDGFYFVIGRKKRFLKIFGLRLSLDEVEQLVKSRFNCECLCAGSDDELIIGVDLANEHEQIKVYIQQKTGLFHGVIKIRFQDSFARNEAGKIILKN